MQKNELRPQARDSGLVVQQLGDESLVYDRESDVAHCLGPAAARVWAGCDGVRDLPALAEFAGVSEDLAAAALDELGDKLLLADEPGLDGAPGVSRRHALKRIASAGLAATAVPLIVSATAATPLALASGSLCAPCTGGGGTSQGTCSAGFHCHPEGCLPSTCKFQGTSGTCTPNPCPGGTTCSTFPCTGATTFCC